MDPGEQTIDILIDEERRYPPTPEFAAQANAQPDIYEREFDEFWEFVSGPIHAGTFGPNELDKTFGPDVKYVKAPEPGQENLSPAAGLQFFGHVKIAGNSGVMTVTLRDSADAALWSIDLTPQPA